MGLIGDIKEVKKLWPQTSLSFRLVLTLSIFFSVSSIASLADTIFQWKGFISDGLDFYSNRIIQPLHKVANNLGIHWSVNQLNVLLIHTTFVIGAIGASSTVSGSIDYMKVVIGITALIFGGYVFSVIPTAFSLWDIIIIYILFMVIPFVMKSDFKFKIYYFAPSTISLFIVFIVAAINAGISR